MLRKTIGSRKYATCPAIPTPTMTATSRFPSANPAEDMVNLMNATRNFQANIAAMTAVKDMILQSIGLMK